MDDLWVNMVRPLLAGIRSNADWIKHHSKEVVDKVNLLPYVPDFETEAQAAISEAIIALETARSSLGRAQEAYGRANRESDQ